MDMRNWKKVVALMLALVLMVSLAAMSAMAEDTKTTEKKLVYTCLGDSIAAGYSLPTYVTRIDSGLVPVEGSYGKIVADTLKADVYHAYGTSGVRTQEMLMFLKDGYYGDAVTNYNMHYWVHTDNIDKELPVLQKQIRDGLAESNLITMGVGINDLWLTVDGILLQLGTGKPYTGPEDAQSMIIMGANAMRIVSIHFLLAAIGIPLSSSFQALGNGIYSTIVSLCRQLVVLLPAAYLLALSGNVDAVWWSFPIAEILSSTMCILFFLRIYKQKIKPIYE